jgi:hypothetical protein
MNRSRNQNNGRFIRNDLNYLQLIEQHSQLIQTFSEFANNISNIYYDLLEHSFNAILNYQQPLLQSHQLRRQPETQQSQTQQSQTQQSQTQQSQTQQSQSEPQTQQSQTQQSQSEPQTQQSQTQPQTQTQTQQSSQTQRSHPNHSPQITHPYRTRFHEPRTNIERSIVNALVDMLNPPNEPRLSQTQLNDKVELTIFENITNPFNTQCSITLKEFTPEERVARIRECGHIFNPSALANWLRMNNTCPICRCNLLNNERSQPVSARNNLAGIIASSDINLNNIYTELINNSQNIPGFQLNSVNDDSIIISFDILNPSFSTQPQSSVPPPASPATSSSTTVPPPASPATSSSTTVPPPASPATSSSTTVPPPASPATSSSIQSTYITPSIDEVD